MSYAETLDLRFAYSTNGHGIVEHDYTPADRPNPPDSRDPNISGAACGEMPFQLITAVQIAWKLWKTGEKKRILYLADRNILIDQPMSREFSIFGDAVWKIQGVAKKGREIYFALYQSISEDENRPGLYREYPRGYFDLLRMSATVAAPPTTPGS